MGQRRGVSRDIGEWLGYIRDNALCKSDELGWQILS